jgi:type I thyroxine 5'-deiodinase
VITIYIVEAHPKDEWALNDGMDEASACIMQPRNLQQRLKAAQDFASRYDYPIDRMVIDNMQNTVAQAYGAEPERLFCVINGKMAYAGGQGPYHYDVHELREFVTSWLRERDAPKKPTGMFARLRRAFVAGDS